MPSIQESNPVPVIGHRGYEVGRGSLGDRTALEEDLRRPAVQAHPLTGIHVFEHGAAENGVSERERVLPFQ